MAGLDLSATATKLLSKLAASAASGVFKVERTTGSAFDPVTGKVTPGTTQEISLTGARVDNLIPVLGESRVVQDSSGYVFDNVTQPLENDILIDNGEKKTIVQIDVKRHADIVQTYIVQATK